MPSVPRGQLYIHVCMSVCTASSLCVCVCEWCLFVFCLHICLLPFIALDLHVHVHVIRPWLYEDMYMYVYNGVVSPFYFEQNIISRPLSVL